MRNKEEKKAIFLQILLYFIVFIIFQNLILKGLTSKIEGYRKESEKKKQEYILTNKRIKNKEEIYRKYYETRAKRDILESTLLKVGQEQYLADKITEISQKYGVTLSDGKYTEKVVDGRAKYQLETRFTTGYEELFYLIEELTHQEKTINIESMSISKKGTMVDVYVLISIYIAN